MISQRQTFVAALVALELGILGAIIYFLGGTGFAASGFSASHVDVGGSREVSVVNAGTTPHVVIRDPDSRVVVSVSQDNRVHVIDESRIHGLFFGATPQITQLHVTQSADGVLVERGPQPSHIGIIGGSTERVEVQVPAAALVDVQKASGSDVSGLQADLKVRSQDGHIDVADTTGNVDLASDYGHIELHNVRAAHVLAITKYGHITADGMTVEGADASATLKTDEGAVRLAGSVSPTGKYAVQTADGRITANLAGAEGLAIDASASDGSIEVNGHRVRSSDDATPYHAAGSAGGSLELASRDGRITLTTSGAM